MTIKKYIHRKEILEEFFLLQESNTDYITKTGNIYKNYGKDKWLKRRNCINNKNGYVYVTITCKDGKNRNRRLHRLLALTFIPNPNPILYSVVGHKNNIKSDYRLENLYWTSTQENTQKAVDDSLMVNDEGINNKDSQPIKVIDLNNELVAVYGSLGEAERYVSNLSKDYISKILKSNKDYKPRNKKYKYFKISKEEYLKTDQIYKFKHLKENELMNKKPKIFKAINLKSNIAIISDNQKQFARDHNLDQTEISQALRSGVILNNWKFILLGEKEYKDSSSYENFINNLKNITIQNIHNNKKVTFSNKKLLKEYLNLKGHSIDNDKQIILNQWKIINNKIN